MHLFWGIPPKMVFLPVGFPLKHQQMGTLKKDTRRSFVPYGWIPPVSVFASNNLLVSPMFPTRHGWGGSSHFWGLFKVD